MSTDAKTEATTGLAALTLEQVRALPLEKLVDLAVRHQLGVRSGMKRQAVLDLVIAFRSGGLGKVFVPGKMLCEVCRSALKVMATEYTSDGKTRLRRVRCDGKHHHRYTMTEAVKAVSIDSSSN